jgi:hypothetical protein
MTGHFEVSLWLIKLGYANRVVGSNLPAKIENRRFLAGLLACFMVDIRAWLLNIPLHFRAECVPSDSTRKKEILHGDFKHYDYSGTRSKCHLCYTR